MNALEAEAAYRMAKGQLDARQITLEEYNRSVAELKYQDNSGTWWAVSPQDGSWLKWTGSAWMPAFTQAVPVTPKEPVQQPVYQQPVQQPAANPSWYIPPVGSQQKPAAAQPVQAPPAYQQLVVASQPVAATVRQPWSIGKKLAVGSIIFGIIAVFVIPYLAGIAGILLGALAVWKKAKIGFIGVATAVLAMAVNYLYIYIF